MKITRKDSAMADFGMLSVGEVFKDTSENILMKIHYVLTCPSDYPDDTVNAINAIDLETGESVLFLGDEPVIPLRAELIVE